MLRLCIWRLCIRTEKYREPCRRGRLHRRPDARERWLYCRKQSRQWKAYRYCRHRPDLCGISADPVSGVNTNNTDLHCSGSDIWWQTVYTKPDVALNHPGRWNWNRSQRLATFVKANSTPIIEDNYFYLMKGFFVSEKGESNGPNLAEANPSDSLTLTTRVYNYSLKSTNDPTLAAPAKDIRVRFYGQLYCTSSSAAEASCKNGSTTCNTPGLCGNSFQIGSDQIIPSIAGFKAEGTSPTGPPPAWISRPPISRPRRAVMPIWSSG